MLKVGGHRVKSGVVTELKVGYHSAKSGWLESEVGDHIIKVDSHSVKSGWSEC